MVFSLATISGVLALCTSVVAHGQVTGIVAGGVYYQGYLPRLAYQESPPKLAGWAIPRDSSNGPVYPASYNNPDIICHVGGTPGAISAKVAAGQTVELQWTPWPISHHGPVIDYLANCNGPCSDVDKTTLRFTKIDAAGLLRNSAAAGQAGYWAADQLRATNNSWTVTIPSTIAAGNYVLRHEIIALHNARTVNGAQNYPHCINLEVTSSGTDKLASGTLGTSLYKEGDPGLEIDIYKPLTTYAMPGPPLYVSGSSNSMPTSNPASKSFTPTQADNRGSTATEASKMEASAVPKTSTAQPPVQTSVRLDDQTAEPSTAAPSSSVNANPTDNGNTIPSSIPESSQQPPDIPNLDSILKAQALRPSFQPHPFQNITNSTTIPHNPESKTPEPPLDDKTPAASTPPQQEADQPSQTPSTPPSSTPPPPPPSPTHKTPKPCHRHRHHKTPSPSPPPPPPPPTSQPPSPPPKKKLQKKPCTSRRRPTSVSVNSSSTIPSSAPGLQTQQSSTTVAQPAPATSASNAAGTGRKNVKGKGCKRRRRTQSS